MEEKNKITKEEMNLVEYPFQYLGRVVPKEVKTIEWSDITITKEGRRVEAKWIVTGSDKYGLPRYRDRDVLLGLLYYWKLQGFQSKELIIDNIAEFLRLLKIERTGRYYEIIEESLNRLTGMTIIAKYSFWNNEKKDYMANIAFHILETAKMEKIGKQYIITVKASDEFWSSIRSGYIKNLDLDFYLSLETPSAKTLYCYLDKKAYRNEHFVIELTKLASHLGIMAKSIWHIREIIREASEILIQRGYLSCYLFEKRNGTEYVIFDFNKDYLDHSFQEELARNETYVQHLMEEIYSVVGKDSPEFIEKVARSVPPDLIFRVLGEIKEMANTGELKTSRYEEFKKLVKRYMKEIYNIKI